MLGPSADSIRLLQGDYSYPAHVEIVFGPVREPGDAAGEVGRSRAPLHPASRPAAQDLIDCFPESVTLLEGIRAAVSAATQVEVVPGLRDSR